LAEGPVRATLRRSPYTDIPGIPFIVAADTNLENEDRTRIEGVTVDVSLEPARPDALANCSTAERAALVRQRCRVVSGEPPVRAQVGGGGDSACTITLPCAADLLLRACSVSFINGTKIRGGLGGGRPPCSETHIGRSAAAWVESPVISQPLVPALLDRENYTLGSTAVLSFATPPHIGRTAGLVVWGNTAEWRHKLLEDVAPGPHRIELGPLGAECRGGCKAALILAVGRRAAPAAGAALLGIPVGKLFSALGPYTMSDAVTIKIVRSEARLDVSVSVAPAVIPPAGDARITVEVKSEGLLAAGAQVAVMVVDRAILDLMPYKLKVSFVDVVETNIGKSLFLAGNHSSKLISKHLLLPQTHRILPPNSSRRILTPSCQSKTSMARVRHVRQSTQHLPLSHAASHSILGYRSLRPSAQAARLRRAIGVARITIPRQAPSTGRTPTTSTRSQRP
jgi:hypothetical protein